MRMEDELDDHETIVNALSRLIRKEMRNVASEQCHPSGSPDDSDDEIKDGKTRIVKFREIRDMFEETSTSIILP